MATANDVLMDTLTCPVCRSVLDKPRSLPCGHTFCLNCIQQLYEQKRNDDSDSDDHDYENVAAAVTVVPCPLCRQPCSTPVNALPVNFAVQNVIAEWICQVRCRTNKLELATMRCRDCLKNLCDACSAQHADGNHICETLIERKCDKHDQKPEPKAPSTDETKALRVIKEIWTFTDALGVTSVDDQLFVLLARYVNQIAVHSINDYKLLHHLSVPGLKRYSMRDMTSCVQHKCLYMSDCDNSCIHRYDLRSSAVIQWRVPDVPLGLSVTPSCNLLVTCRETNKLVELSADSGQCLREVILQPDVVNPSHSVQLTTCQFLVCHGFWNDTLHRVCLVGDDGKVSRSYDGQCGSDVGRLNMARHLAVDTDSQFIFVVDQHNDRVVLLSPTLEFACSVSEKLSRPRGLYLHQPTRRLFVGNKTGKVVVIQL